MCDARPAISADALQAAADHRMPADPGTRYDIAVARHCTTAALVEALRLRGYRVEEPVTERTPEVVLRAMLAAYERAALEAACVYFKIENGVDAESHAIASARLDGQTGTLRDALAAFLTGRDAFAIVDFTGMLDDYQARLAGTRPLDAPPLEET